MKSKLTPEVHEAIVRNIRAGAFKRHAAQAAGVSREALDDWLKRGRAGEAKYAAFARDVDRAQGEDAVRMQVVIQKAALGGDWKAAAFNLEMKHPDLYGRRAEPAVGVTIGSTAADDETGSQRARVEFYMPDNGRRSYDDA